VRETRFFAAESELLAIEIAGRFLHDLAVRWITAKSLQSPPLLTPNF
jgi:hypothetical protein